MSIDGKQHKGKIQIKYGDNFPKKFQSIEVHHDDYGHCLVYVTALGRPYWTEKMSVMIPYKYYITQIIEPNKNYKNKQKQKKIGLHLVR